MTLNDLERRNGHMAIALFRRTR